MNKKIVTIIILTILMLMSMYDTCSAQSTTITASNSTVDSGKEITVSISSATSLSGYTVSIQTLDGCIFKSATVPNSVNGSAKGSTIGGTSGSGTQNLATYKFTAPNVTEDKTCKIKFAISGMLSVDDEELDDTTATATITVKAPVVTPPTDQGQDQEPEQNNPTTPTTPEQPEEPNFTTANKTMYAKNGMNLRASWSTNSAKTWIEAGTEVKVTATSTNKLDDGYIWYKVSYNGKILYAASHLLTDTKPEEKPAEQPKEEPKEEPKKEPTQTIENEPEKNTAEPKHGLKSLEIEGVSISPEFKSDVYEYRVIVKKDISELAINAIPVVEGATVVIAGNSNLQEGENLITIVVYNTKDEAPATYQITTNKSTIDLTETDQMLKAGTESAQRNIIIFAALLATAIVALIVVSILRGKNEAYENEGEEELNPEESTIDEQIVENTDENQENKEETSKFKKAKKKGKHF